MTAQTWRALLKEKYQLSLRLFLFLNAFSALFSIASPLYSVERVTLSLVAVLTSSVGLLIWHARNSHRRININLISLLFGLMWAGQIALKFTTVPGLDLSYLLVALLTVLFIGSLSFINNLSAFICHCLPVVVTVIWLDQAQHLMRMFYAVALPMVGIAIQHIIQKRSDTFSQGLMLKLLEEKETLTDLSMMDPLTGLYNRRGFQNRLEHVLALGTGQHFVMLMDIDHFKAYNDHYGHMMGDQALTRVSAAIRDSVRSRDIVTRYGGEEFLVLLTNSDAQRACQAAERIRQRVYDLRIPHMFNESVATNVTLSIGIAPLEDQDIETALRQADAALYAAKNQGRNHILFADPRHAA